MTTHDVTRSETITETVAALSRTAAEQFADRPAQRFHRDGEWHELTFAQLHTIATEIGCGLIGLGVGPGERVAVLSDTRPEWFQAQLGIAAAGGVVVPIYPSSSVEECEWVLSDSGTVAVVCENSAQLAKVEAVRDRLPELRHVIMVDALAELRSAGGDTAELERRTAAVQPDDPSLIIYTSGTTGRPKGCVLTNRNMTACCRLCAEMEVVTPEDVAYLFLPLAHVFAQTVVLGAASSGALVAYNSGGPTAIMADLQAVRPTFLPSVPRIFEKVFAAIAGMVPAEMREQAVHAGLAVRELRAAGREVPPPLEAGFEKADEQLFSKVRAAFGGSLRQAITGAAPIAPEILQFFHAAGVPVHEGYGLSESAGVGTLNTADALSIGSVGCAVPGCEIRIADDGEILMRGPHIFAGYWKNPEATADILSDGWLLTGDLGSLDEDGFLSITGRKKDIIITAGGKNLTPNNLENDLRQSRWISQALMHGDRRPYPVALITLDAEMVVPWAAERGLPGEVAALAVDPQVRGLVQDVLDQVNSRYAKVSQIKKFTILDHDFSIETGELTPSLKVKRRAVEERYRGLLDDLYG
ncbi:AMP-dependent synthetase/ligase [Pseudonocardia sp. TRM90224]|uniref:AMP-dependent synthetase/ligase n=1 Tax=Pseudonocardia sp. TRM90224 TaxID=2812678 RepID=UPI001E40A16C|nr:AMP-dependent synthetase/ligase [Pseudonocardia sp. TRM90224]